MTDYLGYLLVRGLSLFFRLIPISIGLWIARRLGSLAYYLNKKRAGIAYMNLKAAFGPGLSPEAIKGIVKKVYQNLMQTLIELLTFPRITKKYIEHYVKVEGWQHVREAKEKGKGTIFLTAHFGNWELSSFASGIKEHPILVLARQQKHSRLDDLLNSYRQLSGCKVIKKGFAVKEIVKALHENEIVGMLVDQDAGRAGVFVDFFGRKTSFAHGPLSLALKTGANIHPTFIIREKGPYHRIVIEEPIKIEPTGDKEDDVKRGIQVFARTLESYIRKYPDQWFWLHKRWKSTPDKKILILSDGKAGHLNQSLAIAKTIQGYRPNTTFEVVDVKFKNSALKKAFILGSFFSLRPCRGCMRCLKACLASASYRGLMRHYADIIISCGSSLEGINVILKRETGAKNIILMKPSLQPKKRFSLIIAPCHDRLQKAANVVITEGALSSITDERLKEDSRILAEKIKLERPLRIGVFIGGNNREYRLTPKITHELIDTLIEIACDIDAELLVTTSRRTPPEIERILRDRLSYHMRCKLLLIANERNLPEAVSGILGLSQIVVVSCESISMISEALNAPNYTFVFELEKIRSGISKHQLFLNELVEKGYTKAVSADELFGEIKKAWMTKPHIKRLDDSKRILEGLKKII
jgi:KDO2-lipid IV(A) lauroyltransferase